MRLSEFNYEGGANLEEISTWAVWPMRELVNIFDEEIEDGRDTDKRLLFIMYALRDKLDELDEVIDQWVSQRHKERRTLPYIKSEG